MSIFLRVWIWDFLSAKVDFARKMNVAGVAVFTIDQDDYTGECGQGKFPLMHAIKAAIDERVASWTDCIK